MRKLLLVVAACTHPPAAGPLAGKAAKSVAPDGFATCDVAVLDSHGVLSTWKLAGGRAEQLGHVDIGKPIDLSCDECRAFARDMKAEWADREHLFASPDREHVLMITADGIEQLPMPDVMKLAGPKPHEDSQETGEMGKSYSRIDLVVRAGEAWWSRCPWSSGPDGGGCDGWVNTQLWPASKTNRDDQPITGEHSWHDQAPPGYSVERDACVADGKSVTIEHPAGEGWEYEELYGTHWLSASPPRLLVVWGPHSEFDSPPPDRWQLRDGCAKVLADGYTPRAAAAGTWLAYERDAIVIRRGATELGRIPADTWTTVAVRPAR